MRLFVGVRPSAAALEHAQSAVDRVRPAYPDLRWIPAGRWHLTLAFYGEIPDGKVGGVVTMVSRELRDLTAFTVSLHGAGQFPRRALWLGIDGDLLALRRVARAVTFERRPYRPHLTVARLRGGSDAAGAAEELSGYAGPAWPVTEVHLVRSQLGPAPTYDDIASWTLPAPH